MKESKRQKKLSRLISKTAKTAGLPTELFTFAIGALTLLKCMVATRPELPTFAKPKRKRKIKPFDPSLIPSETVRRVPRIKR